MQRQESRPPGIAGEPSSVKIADDVVAVIAGVAASEVGGVVGMAGGLVGDIGEMLGKRNLAKGVKVLVGQHEAIADIYIVVKYGSCIPDVAHRVQQHVKSAVESMTGLRVVEVNIHVQGVAFPHEEGDDGS
ncbi:MAG TPA: Asp23/Gls24 family envelope stress response protein [Clostridiales bacterium UBA8153]|nr:Asp23/Gls24 family envelope stress response protein [Clostridiales bacterium UBA8153]